MDTKPRSRHRRFPAKPREIYRDRLTAEIARILMKRLRTIPHRQIGYTFDSKRERDMALRNLVKVYVAGINRKKILDAYRKNWGPFPKRNTIPWSFHVEQGASR
jgi:hypothetical protein